MFKKLSLVLIIVNCFIAADLSSLNLGLSASRDENSINVSILSEPNEFGRTISFSWDSMATQLNSYSFSGKPPIETPVIKGTTIQIVLPKLGFLDMNLAFEGIKPCNFFELSLVHGDMNNSKTPGKVSLESKNLSLCEKDSIVFENDVLIQASPNPFNSTVELYAPFEGVMTVHSQDGRTVKNLGLVKESIMWNGTSPDGIPIPSGVYYITISSETEKGIGRVLFIK